MKRYVVTIGYERYALADYEDAVNLLAIADGATRLDGYGPYTKATDQTPFVDEIVLRDVSEEPPVVIEPAPATPSRRSSGDDIPF